LVKHCCQLQRKKNVFLIIEYLWIHAKHPRSQGLDTESLAVKKTGRMELGVYQPLLHKIQQILTINQIKPIKVQIKDQIPILNHFLETKQITEMYYNKKELESQTWSPKKSNMAEVLFSNICFPVESSWTCLNTCPAV